MYSFLYKATNNKYYIDLSLEESEDNASTYGPFSEEMVKKFIKEREITLTDSDLSGLMDVPEYSPNGTLVKNPYPTVAARYGW